jgi:hypothetical protein
MKTKSLVCFSGRILIFFFVLGWTLIFPTAKVLARRSLPDTDLSARDAESLVSDFLDSKEDDPVLYFPIVFRYWPPIPPTPVLQDIDGPIWDSDYSVEWYDSSSEMATPVLSYTLQESSDPTFAGATTYSVLTTSMPYRIESKPWGTMGDFYYRLKAHNAWNESPWSDTQSVWLLSRSDDFNYPQTGWRPRRTSAPDLSDMDAWYDDGQLITLVEDRFDFAIFSPLQEAPELPYKILLRTKVLHAANETSYGIVFGGNKGEFCYVERANAQSSDGCFHHYYRLNVVFGGYLKYQMKRIDYHSERGKGEGDTDWGWGGIDTGEPEGWHGWEIRVYDSGFGLYADGKYLMWASDTRFVNSPYYGIFSSNYEYNGARFAHDYFRVVPLTGAAAVPPHNVDPAISVITR